MVGSVQPERRLLWHPRHDNKFVVGGGSQITLYEWAPDSPEIKHVTSQHDLNFMKCFAWSPDATFDDLIAVGLTTGRVDLMRLEATKSARNSILSSGPIVSLPPRNSRSCNALAFCDADPNYLAVGLDKVRGDSSLVIWDISSASPKLSLSPGLRSVDAVVPSSRPQPQIPRADIGPRTDSRVLQQHAPAEVVSSIAFLPKSTHLLLAGISHRWLRLFDLRSPVPPTTNVATKVHGIATDPFDPHRMACFGDGVVTVWDARHLPHPLLTFTEKDATADGARPRANSTFAAIEFSSTRRGTLAALEKDASYVRFWDIQDAQARGESPDGEHSRDSSQSVRAQRRSWANLPWSASNGSQVSSGEPHASLSKLVLSDTRKTKHFNSPLTSFALVPNAKVHPLTSNVMVVNKDGDLELYAVHDTPKQAVWSSRGDLAIGTGQSYRIFPGFQDNETPPEPWDVPVAPSHPPQSTARSDQTRDESLIRGRGKSNTLPPPIFGRGDEDGFPALNSGANVAAQPPSNIAATRLARGRTYSPASFRTYQFEHTAAAPRSPSREGTADRLASAGADIRARSHRRRSASRGRKQPLKVINHVVEEDISMTMRRRVMRGYGLANPQHNVNITKDDPSDEETLSQLWGWINHSRELLFLPTPRLHGYDFSYQGLLGIWEGFQSAPQTFESAAHTPRTILLELPPAAQVGLGSEHTRSGSSRTKHSKRRSHSPADDIHGDFHAAVLALAARRGFERSSWKPAVPTAKLAQRRLALQICGWSLRDDDLNAAIKRWEKDGKHPQAACWLVFTKQYARAIDLLMRSKDESHHMMSGTLTALALGSNKSPELREHCERLIVRLQDHYFRAMLTQLTSGDWSEVLEEEAMPLRERLAVAFQFLEDNALSSYLRRVTDRSCSRGDIEGIIVTGLTSSGMNILQSYVDRTSDIQTAAILSSYVSPSKFEDPRALRWLDAYRDLLDGFKLFHHRVAFDIERGQILQEAIQNGDVPPFEWAPPQILIRCNYCNKSISARGSAISQKERATACPNCGRALPRCSICLMTLGILQDSARDAELARSMFQDTIDDAIVICQSCRHGGHASHILDWFFGEHGARSHGTCAVPDCSCPCADEL